MILLALEGSIKHALAWNVNCDVRAGQRGSGEGGDRARARARFNATVSSVSTPSEMKDSRIHLQRFKI